jgi:hypothetical protein
MAVSRIPRESVFGALPQLTRFRRRWIKPNRTITNKTPEIIRINVTLSILVPFPASAEPLQAQKHCKSRAMQRKVLRVLLGSWVQLWLAGRVLSCGDRTVRVCQSEGVVWGVCLNVFAPASTAVRMRSRRVAKDSLGIEDGHRHEFVRS